MAKLFSIAPSTFADDFKAALEAYYGDGVTIESASDSTIIFQCPAVCDKVLKFISGTHFKAYIGDTSASMQLFSSSYQGSANEFILILSDAFILMDAVSTIDYRNSALVGKLTNGRYMAVGGTVHTNTSDYARATNKGFFTDTMVHCPIRMVTPYAQTVRCGNRLALLPSYVIEDINIQMNADGTFATIPGLMIAFTKGTPVDGGNFYLSQSGLHGLASEGEFCTTQKYVELEME